MPARLKFTSVAEHTNVEGSSKLIAWDCYGRGWVCRLDRYGDARNWERDSAFDAPEDDVRAQEKIQEKADSVLKYTDLWWAAKIIAKQEFRSLDIEKLQSILEKNQNDSAADGSFDETAWRLLKVFINDPCVRTQNAFLEYVEAEAIS